MASIDTFPILLHSPVLNSRITYGTPFKTSEYILGDVDTTKAYIVGATYGDYLLAMVDYANTNDGPVFRLMKENLGCGLIAYRMSPNFVYRKATGRAIQHIREAGLYTSYVQWTLRYLRSVYPPLPIPDPNRNHPIGWQGIEQLYYMYLLGMLLGLSAFVAERCVHKRKLAKASKRPRV